MIIREVRNGLVNLKRTYAGKPAENSYSVLLNTFDAKIKEFERFQDSYEVSKESSNLDGRPDGSWVIPRRDSKSSS